MDDSLHQPARRIESAFPSIPTKNWHNPQQTERTEGGYSHNGIFPYYSSIPSQLARSHLPLMSM